MGEGHAPNICTETWYFVKLIGANKMYFKKKLKLKIKNIFKKGVTIMGDQKF